MRTEHDVLGSYKLPSDAPWGIYTQRVLDTYPQDEIARVPEAFLRLYIQAKMVYATINQCHEKIDKKIADAIHAAGKKLLELSWEEFSKFFLISQIQSGGGTSTNMMINEVIANEATVLIWWDYGDYLVDPHDHVNRSQSSNDTFPGVTKLFLILQSKVLLQALTSLKDSLSSHARVWKELKKVWRTHLQDAVVITLWEEFWAYARTVEKSLDTLRFATDRLKELNFGGTATGSLQNITPELRKDLIEKFSRMFEIDFVQPIDYFEQNSSSWDIAYFSFTLARVASDLLKMTNDLRLLGSWPLAGINEIDLPSVQPGSSIMPGKVNPSVLEAYTMVAARVIGNDQTVQTITRLAQLELQQFMPQIAWSSIDSVMMLTKAVTMLDVHCIQWITANEDRIKQLLEKSFATATDYSERLGYEVVADAVQEALHGGKSLHEILCVIRGLCDWENDW